MTGVGLLKLVSQLQLQPEIDAARNIHERSSLVWESKDLLELLEKRANEWLLLPNFFPRLVNKSMLLLDPLLVMLQIATSGWVVNAPSLTASSNTIHLIRVDQT